MKSKKKEDLSWRRLDNYAKLFPLASTKRYSSVFRISITLKEKIDPNILEKAVNKALVKFKLFKVRMRRGFFWYYFENNTKSVVIEEEHDYPCKYIDLPANNDYLFKITYFENKVLFDFNKSVVRYNTPKIIAVIKTMLVVIIIAIIIFVFLAIICIPSIYIID